MISVYYVSSIVDPWEDALCQKIIKWFKEHDNEKLTLDIIKKEIAHSTLTTNVTTSLVSMLLNGFLVCRRFGEYELLNENPDRAIEWMLIQKQHRMRMQGALSLSAVSQPDMIPAFETAVETETPPAEGSIHMKVGRSCHGFRCLICWFAILPDDDVVEEGAGYAHKVCQETRKRNQKLAEERKARNKKSSKQWLAKKIKQLTLSVWKLFPNRECAKCGRKDNLRIASKTLPAKVGSTNRIKRLQDILANPQDYIVMCNGCNGYRVALLNTAERKW